LKDILGSDQVQEAAQVIVYAKVDMNLERMTQQAVQSFIRSYEIVFPKLQAAVAACKTDRDYDSGNNVAPGPGWTGTTLGSDGGNNSVPQGGHKYKPNTGWNGTSRPSSRSLKFPI
jgi:hypothetical protein